MTVTSGMIDKIRHGVARKLRTAAFLLDGRKYVTAELHQLSVRTMNSYIGQTERYIVALEKLVLGLAAVGGSPDVVEDLRKKHHRFDTRKLLEAGAWPEVAEPAPYRTGEA